MLPPDLTFLQKPLAAASQDLAASDGRLVALGDIAEKEDWQEVTTRVEALLDEGVFDVRPLCYYFYAAFVAGGLGAVPALFEGVTAATGANFASIGPKRRQSHHFDKRLTWLFDKILGTVRYHELKRTPVWTGWHEGLAPNAIARGIAAGDALAAKLGEGPPGPFDQAARALGALGAWLRAHDEAVNGQPAPRKPTDRPSSPTRAEDDDLPPPPPPEEASAEVLTPEQALEALRRRVTIVVSHHYTELVSKLRAFETLVEAGHYEKAALVADDVQQRLEHFDPRDYFPELFARFSALFSKNVDSLSEHMDRRESPQWKALAQFYQVDMKAFVES